MHTLSKENLLLAWKEKNMPTELKRIVVYLTDEEMERIKTKADDKSRTVSAYARAKLGLKEKLRGAPEGNRNAAGRRRGR